MKKVTAEAFEDTSRPEGGHAVILIVGLGGVSDHPTFRLRPVDSGLAADHRGLWAGRPVSPLATRQTERGTEFVVGPDIVDNPLLLAGTAVSIEIPEAMVRGEFLWPNVTSLAQPKRRHVVSSRRSRTPEPAEQPGLDVSMAAPIGVDDGLATEQLPGVSMQLPAVVVPGHELIASGEQEQPNADAVLLRSAHRSGGWAAEQSHRSGKRWFASVATACAVVIGFTLLVQSVREKAAREADELDVASVSQTVRQDAVAAAVGAVMKPSQATAVQLPPLPVSCELPSISSDPLDGGRMRLRFASACHAGQKVKLSYGGADFVRDVDSAGAFDDVVDGFAGPASSVDIVFQDGKTQTVKMAANDFNRITKIAVFWQAPVNLDLHVFEYAAKPQQKGHIFAKAPSDATAAQDAVSADHRGHGFMSTLGDGTSDHRMVEVYTLLHHGEQVSGLITMAVDYETRGDTPSASTCRGGALAEMPFQISVLDRRGQISTQAGILAAAECGKALDSKTRFDDSVLTPIKIGK